MAGKLKVKSQPGANPTGPATMTLWCSYGSRTGKTGMARETLKRETRFAAGFPIAFHRDQR